MPCYDPPIWQDEFGVWHDGERPKKWCDKMTRMLCCAMRLIEAEYGPHYVGGVADNGCANELKEWWTKHQEWDRQRRNDERKAEQRRKDHLKRKR